MKRRSILVVGLGATLSIPGTGRAQPLDLREIASTRGLSTAPFGSIADLLYIGDEKVVVSDDLNGILYLWDIKDGGVSVFARHGEGPGEVLTPTQLARRPSGGFAVYDIEASAVKLFDTSGAPDGTWWVSGIVSNPKSMAFWGDEHLLLSGGRLTDPRQIHLIDRQGRRVASYGDPSPLITSNYPLIQSAGGALWPLPGGEMVFSYGRPLRVVVFETEVLADPTIWTEDLQILPELREEEVYWQSDDHPGSKIYDWWHDRTTGAFVYPDGRLLNVITRFHSEESDWLIFSPGGDLLSSLSEPTAYFAYDMTSDGRVLAVRRLPNTDEHVAAVLTVAGDGA